jgi:hypothetical protein
MKRPLIFILAFFQIILLNAADLETQFDPESGKYFLKDKKTGKAVSTKKYNQVFLNKDKSQPHRYKEEGKYGFISADGKTTGKPLYSSAYDFKKGFGKARKGTVTLFLNQNFDEVFSSPELTQGEYSPDGIAYKKDNKFGILNGKGGVVTEPIFDAAGNMSDGLIPVMKDNKWAYYNNLGAAVTGFDFDQAVDFSEGFAAVGKTSHFKPDSPLKSISTKHLSEEYIRGKMYYTWGFIDPKGNLVVPFKYTQVYSFSEGVAVVKTEGGFGAINYQGK